MSLTAAVWPQFATHVFRGGIGRLTCIRSYVNKQVTTFTFKAQAITCSKHHTRTVMDAGCECAPWVRSANPSDSWVLVVSGTKLKLLSLNVEGVVVDHLLFRFWISPSVPETFAMKVWSCPKSRWLVRPQILRVQALKIKFVPEFSSLLRGTPRGQVW